MSAATKRRVKSGKNDPKANDGTKTKWEKLGGSPLKLFLDSDLTKVVEYNDNEGEACTKVMIPMSTQEGINASEGRNIPSLLLEEMGLAIHWGNCTSHNIAATLTLKNNLRTNMKMKMDDRVRDGRKEYSSDSVSAENMPLIFYFKGRASDVAQYQHYVEPADPPTN